MIVLRFCCCYWFVCLQRNRLIALGLKEQCEQKRRRIEKSLRKQDKNKQNNLSGKKLEEDLFE